MRKRSRDTPEGPPAETLPDLLRGGLDLVLVGINPSVYSAEQGHYFARPGNRFWPCFSRSRLSLRARRALGVTRLEPHHDRALPAYGIGFTDLVKRPTAKASALGRAELERAVAALVAKIERHRPRVACFHGITAYGPVQQVLAPNAAKPALGLQPLAVGGARLYLVPNPSGANAHASPAVLTECYDGLDELLTTLD